MTQQHVSDTGGRDTTGLVDTYMQPVIPQPAVPIEIGGGTNYKVHIHSDNYMLTDI